MYSKANRLIRFFYGLAPTSPLTFGLLPVIPIADTFIAIKTCTVKKTFFPLMMAICLHANAQPKLIGTFQFHGPQYGGSIFRFDLPASSPGNIHSFDNANPHRPNGGVIAGNDDWLYGSLLVNGTNNNGGLYKIRRDGTNFTMLLNYDNPYTSLPYYHTDQLIYVMGGNEIFQYDPLSNTSTVLANNAFSRFLHIDADDWIYYQGVGNLFRIRTDGTNETMLHSFTYPNEGHDPVGITEASSGKLFGLQRNGGANSGGTIFSIDKTGANFTIVHHFASATGTIPVSKLMAFDGKLFGTTVNGGDFGFGTLFTLNEDGTGFRVLYHFNGGNSNAYSSGNIAISSNGRIFGSFGSFVWDGSSFKKLFKIDTSGNNFQLIYPGTPREHGSSGQDVLLLDDEDIYVTDAEYGRHEGGVLNLFDTNGFGAATYHFGYSINGFRPGGGVIKASDGKIYGTTIIGGTSGNGTIYSSNADGTGFIRLHEFTDLEGYEPAGNLLEASDGKLYGACRFGDTHSGILYRLDKNGSNFQVILRFDGVIDGNSPMGSLIEDASGVLYGTTFYSFQVGGTVFKVNKDGTGYQVLKSFSGSGTDLSYPYNGVRLSKGYLYGCAGLGGTEGKGGIFRIKTDGTGYQVLHEFTSATGGGSLPVGTILIASNGKLYGVCASGGTNGDGALFSVDTTGSNFNVHHNFTMAINGAYPWGGLIQASDGLIYGTTSISSINPANGAAGTMFRMNLDGTGFTVIREFNSELEGQGVTSTLLDLNGNFTLPVEWLNFTARKKTSNVELTWQTAAEYNNDRYEIERSIDGSRFTTIGFVLSRNQSNGATYYFYDEDPQNGFNYYRIKQVDVDHKFTYSRVVKLNFNAIHLITIRPNPAKDMLSINIPAGMKITAASIIDPSGRTVKRFDNMHGSGLAISTLAPGQYFLQITSNLGRHLMSFVKQ